MNDKIIFTNELVSEGTKREKFKQNRIAQNLKRNVKVLKLPEMKEHGEKLYDIFRANEDYLISGYENKKLKSKKLIKQVRRIITQRNKENKEVSETE